MIHKCPLNGWNLMVDVNSGAIHAADELAYALCGPEGLKNPDDLDTDFTIRHDAKEVKDTYEELLSLIKQGLLYQYIRNLSYK